ncbi:REP-associated tyrosine transposase [Thioalkalivibrio sp.]|uniref:REP-associated tyrosine transposase n=1 Tax=Thioalkalivibrio sp. TaxID=2093813 RepID=UPI003563374D
MPEYRRAFIAGGCYFFTVVIQDRRPILTEPANIARLREGFRRTMQARPFQIDAVVVLPDHLHTVWRLPEGDDDYPSRWRRIKHYFSVGQASVIGRGSLARRREKGIWQRRYWEHLIADDEDWRRHVDYIHYNPVKHGYVEHPGDWPYSSFALAVRKGWHDADWGNVPPTRIDAVKGGE